MEKMSKFKLLKFPSFFTSSCKTQNIDEVIDHSKTPIFTLQESFFTQTQINENLQNYEEEEEENEKYPFRNIVIKPQKINNNNSSTLMNCKPKCPKTFDQMVRENCIISTAGNSIIRRKVTGKYSMLSPSGDFPGRKCPPTSPASPLFSKQGKMHKKNNKKKKKEKGKKTHFGNNNNNYYNYNGFNYSSNESDYNNGDCFSSDDEREDNYYDDDEKSTMFSLKSISTFSSKSKSFSSDDSDEFETRTRTRTRTQTRARPRGHTRPRRRKTGSRPKEVGVIPLEKKVKDTFAIVKSSSDPHNDFRTSMVEMIIEKQIFGAKELEQLLKCFLSLNSSHHHRVIVQVFSEICDALFS